MIYVKDKGTFDKGEERDCEHILSTVLVLGTNININYLK